jgi:hypothetical protein
MNNIFFTLQRFYFRLSRLHRRCGYHVHSPFAFELITQVIYEKKAYYAYKELEVGQRKQMRMFGTEDKQVEFQKVNRLLLRLVNKAQPETIVDAGMLSYSALYLQAGKPSANYVPASGLTDLFLEKDVLVDFLYLHDYKNPALMEEIFQVCVARAREQSMFVIGGIGYSKQMRMFWKRLMADKRVEITFDLYDVGILCFDKTKVKQHYQIYF